LEDILKHVLVECYIQQLWFFSVDSGIIQYGYVQKQDERIVLKFTKNGTILNKILCTKKPSPKEVKGEWNAKWSLFIYMVNFTLRCL
jgi:hypothetical protein